MTRTIELYLDYLEKIRKHKCTDRSSLVYFSG